MRSIDQSIRRAGWFLRRRELLALGYADHSIRHALEMKRIFRVRHGWYSVPDAPESAIMAVRVGGRLTSVSALLSYGLRVPRGDMLHVAVPATAARLRSPHDKHTRLHFGAMVRVHWADTRDGGERWRVSVDDALLAVLLERSRDVAVACLSAALHHRLTTVRQLDAIFARAPARVQRWRCLVSTLDESHGETFVRLWLLDAGIHFEQQSTVRGAGRFDFRVGPSTYVEVDGAQHDPDWTGEGPSSWAGDLDRALTVVGGNGTVIHVGYQLLHQQWGRVCAAIRVAIADDLVLAAYRRRQSARASAAGSSGSLPVASAAPSAARRKRRKSRAKPPW
ncbi:hypothetical protein FB562_1710 [Homoserinimonas aerilata]|uniref:Uncharacterized protein n=1 Tax=Homoserinimonas aerilata TaxID=1162970 RepID=A0A542YKJ4_9MICO|nr:hypothetical protein [Homoserinimonas aerilata]TQL48613.1 hypothetical protein FB562_1710 [Homoserinimonas aerilata]